MSKEEKLVYEYKGSLYPTYIKHGKANKYIEPFAKEFCKGKGLDIGGFSDWVFPGAKPINVVIDDEWDAYHLPDEKYDYIISGLPHINFPTEVVEQITASYFKLLKPGGMLSYFEYMYVRPLRKMVTLGNGRRRVREVNAIMEGHIGRHRVRRENILINVPPVWVQHLHLDTTA